MFIAKKFKIYQVHSLCLGGKKKNKLKTNFTANGMFEIVPRQVSVT